MKITFGSALLVIASQSVWAGPVIIDGTDANDIGHGSLSNGVNSGGWLYMQKALENLAPQVDPTVVKVVVDIGTTDIGTNEFGARAAINSAFGLSSLPSNGWRLVHIDGPGPIESWLSVLSTSNTGILYIPTADNAVADLDSDELAVVNAHGPEIADFVGGGGKPLLGGGLFAMSESPLIAGTPYGWLINVLPGISVTDVGPGGIFTPLTLTADGQAAFPGLSSVDLSTGPWHNYFEGDFGGLNVLATAPDDAGVTRNIIIGGGAGTSITSLHNECITRTARFWFTHPYDPADPTNPDCATLLNAVKAASGRVSLGFISLPIEFHGTDNTKDATDAVPEILGLYWKKPGRTVGATNLVTASRLCRERKRLSIELVAATANVRLLGTQPGNCSSVINGVETNFSATLLTQARTTAAGEDVDAIRAMTILLRQFNLSGVTNNFFGNLLECSPVKGKILRQIARDPTTVLSCPGVNNSCGTAEAIIFPSSSDPFARASFSRTVSLVGFDSTLTNFPGPTCVTTIPAASPGAIWKITPSVGVANRQFTADTFGSNFDTVLQVYSGTCNNPVVVANACNDDAAGTVQSQVTFRTDGTNTFFIVAESKNGQLGRLKFHVTSP